MRILHLCKTALVATVAVFFTAVAFGNLTDYSTNWQFIQHTMSMDTVPSDVTLKWRAVTNPILQTTVYWSIIAWESATAVVLWLGTVRLLSALTSHRSFVGARTTAVAGLTMGIVLYFLGFLVIAGEWFSMWRSPTWNAQSTAFGFVNMIGLVLVVVLVGEVND